MSVLLWTCCFAALGGFLFGYDLGLIGSALLQIKQYFKISSSATLGLIVGVAKLGAAAGTFLGGAAMARYGRQRALALNSIAYVAGPVIMAAATAPWMLVLGRFVVGLGVGMSATVSPAYIAEVAPAATRGMLVQLYEVMLCIGMLLAPLVNWLLSRVDPDDSWRAMVGLPALPGLVLAAAPLVLPESPRWLVTRNRLEEALQVITMVMRGSGALARGPEALWSGGYSRMNDKDDETVRDAEDELLQLWSGVQLDRNAVLEQRRKLWRLRQQRTGRRWGRLGCWNGQQGRPKTPSLAPIPEESGSQVPTPSCRSRSSSSAAIAITTMTMATTTTAATAAATGATATTGAAAAAALATAGISGGGAGGTWDGEARLPVSSPPALGSGFAVGAHASAGGVTHGSSPPRQQQQHLEACGGNGVGSHGGSGAGSSGSSSVCGTGPSRTLGVLGRWREGGGGGGGGWGVAGEGAYRVLASDEAGASPNAMECGGSGPGSGSGRSDERQPLLPPRRAASGDEEDAEGALGSSPLLGAAASPSAPSSSSLYGGPPPPASLADMPGEEPSFFRTLAVLIADIGALAVGPERRALWLALGLAFFDQVTAATAIINYAPTLLKRLGGDDGSAMLYTVLIGATKAVGVVVALLLVDHCGRRPLLVIGSLACSVALGGLTVANLAGSPDMMEAAMCAFTLFFSLSWAGLYWVVVSELFSMPAKSAATSAATGLLFLTGAVTNLVFLSLHDLLGSHAFLLFAALCLASAAYVWVLLPETKGRTLAEVQVLLAGAGGGGAGGSGRSRSSGWIQLWARSAEEGR